MLRNCPRAAGFLQIELKSISKIYTASPGVPPFQALKSVDLTIEAGEMIAIKGSSGAGKSTLLHIIGCLDRPTSGAYLMHGQEATRMSSSQLATIRNTHFGFVMQHFALIEDDDALQNVAAPLLFSKTKLSHMDGLAMQQLCYVGIPHLAKKKVAKLSGGEKQRVAIARAMVNDPQVILADEPTGALDRENSEKIVGLFQQLNTQGKTIIIVTHDDYVANSCHRIVTIADGVVTKSDEHPTTRPSCETKE